METKKSQAREFTSLFQLFKTQTSNLPQFFAYSGEDSYEFELIIDHYKETLSKSAGTYEIILIVSESGEQAKLFAELFTPDMFYPRKLIIVKQATALFKPILDTKSAQEWKDFASGFRKNITSVSDEIFLLVHYDSKDIPQSLIQLFQSTLNYYKTKFLYPSDYPKVFKDVCDQEQVHFESNASDEFIHRVPANVGAYLKSVKKLKQYLHRSKFTIEDINAVLFSQNELNTNILVESLIQKRKVDFFKEFTKFSDQNSEILSFLTRLTYKLDEIRKIKVIRSRHNGEVPIPLMDELLKTGSYSDARKNFVRRQLVSDSAIFTDKILDQFYDQVIEMNIKFKSGLRDEEGKNYFLQKIMHLFSLLQERSSN
ncbi:DNA polymerase III, delta subunit [Leptospira wolbachii serovar Codice str. CDC]|uniref:DNA polymerase III, delta subunit n=1 Tax=Leptospira wolbachii serovar Codice str. CDC TaxID=1218599 RepID=R9A602_9LEPT|nr:DNA polymerase III, delta subunit [Leptospira wolbachii]EOQ95670.1 DNA polymerase III, delta subunit [Leptospira wolbachii serovar Codice str. CDC]